MASMICRKCGSSNQSGRTVCWNCGTRLTSQFEFAPTANPADSARGQAMQEMRRRGNLWGSRSIVCMNCGTQQDFARTRCLQCGADLGSDPWVCSVCGNENKRASHVCVFCQEPTGPLPADTPLPNAEAQPKRLPEQDTLVPLKFDMSTGEALTAPEPLPSPGGFRCPSCGTELHMGTDKRPGQLLKNCPSCGVRLAIQDWVCPRCLQLNPVAGEQCCFCGTKSGPEGRHAARAVYDNMLKRAGATLRQNQASTAQSQRKKMEYDAARKATGGSIFGSILVLVLGILAAVFAFQILGEDKLYEAAGDKYGLYILLIYAACVILCYCPICYKKVGNEKVFADGSKPLLMIGLILASLAFMYVIIELFVYYAKFHDFNDAWGFVLGLESLY